MVLYQKDDIEILDSDVSSCIVHRVHSSSKMTRVCMHTTDHEMFTFSLCCQYTANSMTVLTCVAACSCTACILWCSVLYMG